MKQRWALVVIGVWLMGSIHVGGRDWIFAMDVCRRGSGPFTAMVQKLGSRRRGTASVSFIRADRLYFQMWNVAQIGLGVLVLWLVAGSTEQGPAQQSSRCWRSSC
jgi:hypothetical protein